MKKVFLATLVAGLMSVSAFGDVVEGKVGFIKSDANNNAVIVEVIDANGAKSAKRLAGTADQKKIALTLALTAKSTNADVKFVNAAGDPGWTNLIVK